MSLTDRYRVAPGQKIALKDWITDDTSPFDGDKKDGEKAFGQLNERLERLQELFYAEGKKKLLIVLQGMDTSGKDGTIRHIFDGVNPTGVKVASFKKPNSLELAHDYLWRIHSQAPANGEIVVYNRSHYEDVLVVRVHELVPKERWSKRYEHINAYEKLLADEGTIILKFFLHISKEEQRERLQERLDDPEKHWKFDKNDLAEREHWDAYQVAYEDAISKTSSDYAPWYIVPADKKWYRNLVISTVIVETLDAMNCCYPKVESLAGIKVV